MTEERDDKVSASYRALGREEPPRALDEAILAAARRRPRSFASRWSLPVSLAAVVVLSVTVTVMVQDTPEIYTQPSTGDLVTARLREADAPKVGALKREAPKVEARAEAPRPAAPKPEEPKADLNALAMRAPEASTERAKLMKEQEQPPREAKNEMRSSAVIQPRPSFVPDPAPASSRAASAGTAAETPAPAAAAAPPPAPRMAQRRLDDGARDRAEPQVLSEATAKRMQEAAQTPEKELERVAEMRLAGRHEEADKALAEFRKRYPDYRISEAMLQRVERRGAAR